MERSATRDSTIPPRRPPRISLRSIRATGSPHHHRHLPLRLARRLHCDLDVLAERGQKLDQPADGEIFGAVAYQRRDMRLFDAEELGHLRLGQAARLDDLVDLQREPGLQKLLLGIGQTETGKHVAASGRTNLGLALGITHASILIANYKNFRNSATVIPDCAMIPRSVPRLRSPLWTGTVTLRTGSVAWMSRQ